MKLILTAVGRSMPPPIRTLVTEYRERLQHFGGVELLEVAETRRTATDTPAHRQQGLLLEAKRIRERLPQPVILIPLDATGRMLSSLQLADMVDGLATTVNDGLLCDRRSRRTARGVVASGFVVSFAGNHDLSTHAGTGAASGTTLPRVYHLASGSVSPVE